MHILVLTLYYLPDSSGIASLTAELCEHLASRGHKVSVVTGFPHYPEWRIPRRYRKQLWLKESINDVTVYRGYIYVPIRRTPFKRIIYDTSIAVSGLLWGCRIPKVDVVLAISTPLQLGLTGYFISRIKKAPFVFGVQDLVPDLAIALGMLKNTIAIRVAHKLELFVYCKSHAICVPCEGFRNNLVSKRVPESKIFLLSNWVDTSFIDPQAAKGRFRELHHISEKSFLVLHTGNMGTKQKLENVINAAAELQQEKDVLFILVGDGSEREYLEKFSERKAPGVVRFLPLQPRELLPDMLCEADVLLLNQSAAVIDMVVPSKLLTYMAAGRPVVAAVNSQSEAARYINEAGCGFVLQPESPEELAKAILKLRKDDKLARSLGNQGRIYAEKHFARNTILNRYEAMFTTFTKSVANG